VRDIYIHVGFPKTGTTFLQRRCFPKLKGVHVVRYHQDVGLTGLLRTLWRIVDAYPLFVDMDKHRSEVNQFLQGVPQDKLLITLESLAGNALRGFRENAQATESLRELFPSAKIILTIRRQDTFLESLYRQFLWAYYDPTIDDFLSFRDHEFINWFRAPPAYPSINVWRLDYHVYAQNYAAAFGRENVLVLPQEMLRNDPRTFHVRLADFLDVEPYFPPPGSDELNRGYSSRSCRIAFRLNRFVRAPWRDARPWHVIPHEPLTPYLRRRDRRDQTYRLLDALNRRLSLRYVLKNVVDRFHYRQGDILGDEKRRLLLDIHRESNRMLDKEYDINLQQYGYY
jgi:hypothetical protein